MSATLSLPQKQTVGAVVTAGGTGVRFGGFKQFQPLGGRSVLAHAVATASRFAAAVAVPVPAGHEAVARAAVAGAPVLFAAGGATRALSVLAGLRALPELEWVLVHDAARPFASDDLFARVLAAAVRTGAAIPALPCHDTVKVVAEALVVETLDRDALRLVQTPQVFRRAALLEAYERLGPAAATRTDDAAVYEVLGLPVAWVEGEPANRKLTRPEDLPSADGREGSTMRIGVGYDVHAFGPGRPLVLAGLHFEGDGLLGDSDADIVAHAVTDAVLGAAGLGDLGCHFPPGDARFLNARSLDLLATAVGLIQAAGYRVGNVDLTLAARRPKIAPRAREMAHALALVLQVSDGDVNVKATTGDGLGFVGRAEGIAVHAVVLLWRAQLPRDT